MKINIHETLMNLNRGRISVDQAHDEIESAMCEANACPQLADVRALGDVICEIGKYMPDESSALGELYKELISKYNKVGEYFS